MNSKKRCTTCKVYYPAEEMYRQGVSGVCSELCLFTLKNKARERQVRKQDHKVQWRENKRRNSSGTIKPKRHPGIPAQVRDEVRLRDRHCRRCGSTNNLHVHHIRYRSEGGCHTLDNLLLCCRTCHAMFHTSKRVWQPLLIELLRREYDLGEHLYVGQLQTLLKREGLKHNDNYKH